MIRVTIFNEFVEEQMDVKVFDFMKDWNVSEDTKKQFAEKAKSIREIHTDGSIHGTLKALLEEEEDIEVRHIATTEMEQNGLTEAVLRDTDLLVWWAHIAHDQVSDEVAMRVVREVQNGMGLIVLHSGHMAKPFRYLLGTSGTLRWREGDFCRVWNISPTHPIAKGIPAYFELPMEEMYGEYFDIAKPDDVVFNSWFAGGELFRSGCTWTRGYGRIFYFQPGHETYPSYFNEYVRRILKNAAHWCSANMELRRENLDCLPIEGPMTNPNNYKN